MSRSELSSVRFHEDPDFFREAVNFTQAATSFRGPLIEKDYFCTVLLHYVMAESDEVVFKGGTCLSKVHAGFYRMSEDLDFVIPMPIEASRHERSKKATGLKAAVAALPGHVPIFRISQPLTGANSSTQYIASIHYTSLLDRQEETINIELGLREPLLTPVLQGSAQTLLQNPVSGQALVKPASIRCISHTEAFAEKFRAAFSRRDVAIRDFYDIDYAARKRALPTQEAKFMKLIQQKLAVPGNDPVDVSDRRLAALRKQLDSELKPVLKAKDFSDFDLERAFRIVSQMASKLL